MKAIILCGGKGTRFNKGKPGPLKPLIKINGTPILRHIINIYKKNNINNFILLGGYKFKELEKFSKKNKDVKITTLFTGVNTCPKTQNLYLDDLKLFQKNISPN